MEQKIYIAQIIAASEIDFEFFSAEEKAAAWAEESNQEFIAEYLSRDAWSNDSCSKEWVVCSLKDHLDDLENLAEEEELKRKDHVLNSLMFNGFNS